MVNFMQNAHTSQQRQTKKMHDLDALFNPQSLAIVGASSDPKKLSGRAIHYMKTYGFKGKLYPVNPSSPEIQGLPAYPSVFEIPGSVDQAVIIVPSSRVEESLRDCAKKGVKVVQVLSSGFGEMGPEGKVAQDKLVDIARQAGMRMVGPNSLGALSPSNGLFATFSTSFARGAAPKSGKVAFVTQSGAFGSCTYVMADLRGVGMSRTLATGNEADVDVASCIDYLAEDPLTEVICASMESCRNGDQLRTAIHKASRAGKAVIMMKVGTSEAGAAAAATHTGSLAGDDRVYDTILRETGAWRARSIEEMVDIAYLLVNGQMPANSRVSLVTVSGGIGILMADDGARMGLEIKPFSKTLMEALAVVLPYGAGHNPYDTTAQVATTPQIVVDVGQCILQHTQDDSLIFYLANNGLAPLVFKDTLNALLRLKASCKDRLIVVIMPSEAGVRAELEQAGIPVFEDPTRAVAAISAACRIRQRRNAMPALGQPPQPSRLAFQPSDESKAKQLLRQEGIPVIEERVCLTAKDAIQAANDFGYPIVAKILSPDIQHKTEIGGVLLGLAHATEVEAGFETLMQRVKSARPDARIEGVLISRMVSKGVETLVGMHRDPVFGPMIMFGLGGIMVELFKDVSMASAPLDQVRAHQLIDSVKSAILLKGWRGSEPLDCDALAEVLCKISAMACKYPEIQSIDINPLLVQASGVVALDAVVST
jgi:acyl-CoA synthetase (NDP forming)